MTLCMFRSVVLVAAAVTLTACGSESADNEKRLAELEAKLKDTQKQLADSQGAPAQPAEPAAPPASTAAAGNPSGPASNQSSGPPPARTASNQAEVQRLTEQQKAVNSRQTEADVRLQQQIDQLKPVDVVLPAGTLLALRTTSELSTAKVSNGSTFEALLEEDLKSGNTLIAKAGSRVTGVVIESDPGGRVKGTASLTVGARSIGGPKGAAIAVKTDSFTVDAASTKKRNATRTGIATGVGAVIGGIAGGGSGAAIGAATGAGAGVGVDLATRGDPAVIPGESLIELRLVAPLTVTIQP